MKKNIMKTDKEYMEIALQQGRVALKKGEIPIGAIIIDNESGKVISKAYNTRNKTHLSTAHAEILAINKASRRLKDWRLTNTTIFVTIEPCPMCAGAIFNARIPRLVYGSPSTDNGAFGGIIDMSKTNCLNHNLEVTRDILPDKCLALLHEFFQTKRKR